VETPAPLPESDLDDLTRVIHLGLAFLGVLALVTGFFADDYKRLAHPGFTLHRWLGLSFSCLLFYRLWLGFFGRQADLWREWVPYTPARLQEVGEDIANLLSLKLPDRPTHRGLAGVVEIFGVAAFAWMAASGALMFFFLESGHKARGFLHVIKELHEAGLWFMVVFLIIHVGAVLLHALGGHPYWRRAFFLDRPEDR
jgi:cytochrome b561